jgi:succinate-semialdehyde dehydrogenase/glutarate-semialdehyde dehydrogenase
MQTLEQVHDTYADLGLKDPTLLRSQGLIGNWCDADSGERFGVFNPANDQLIVELPRMGASETRRAIEYAQAAFAGWVDLGVDGRYAILKAWAQLLRDNHQDIGRILTSEQGKSLVEGTGEVLYSATFIDWFAEEACRAYGQLVPSHNADSRFLVSREPVGVGAAITPWNFPGAMIARKVGPALAAGCPIVIKPSSYAPLTTLAFAELACRAGVPSGVISVIVGDHSVTAEIGGEITSNPLVKKISFTGSTEVGKVLMAQSAKTVKRVSMELGGNAPFIVFDDADLDAAVAGLMGAKFRNAGQTCVSANRIYVQESVHDQFVERLVTAVEALTVGDGIEPGTDMGPLINAAAVDKVEQHVADAIARGGTLVSGGQRHSLGGCFFEPTVVTGVTSEMRACCEETFGPLAAIVSFKNEEEVVAMANDTPYGLAAYFYTTNRARAWRVSEALQAGIVCENTVAFSSARAPFGGYKESGVGKEGGEIGLHEWTDTKYRCIGGLA